jgi:curved DNA-binding protein CbpA
MRSAYLVLGVPGNATPEEIEVAFHKAERLYPKERLAQEEGALGRLTEVRGAYQLLRDPESRAAHDRKLAGQIRPAVKSRTVVIEAADPTPMRRVMLAGVWLSVVVFAAGIYLSYRNAETRRVVAAQELAARKAAEQEAEQARVAEQQQAAQRAQLAAQAEAKERQLVTESRIASSRAAADMRMQESAAANARRVELAEAQRSEASRLNEERRAAMEARQRTERDKQRIRELCYQQYRRQDC